MKEQDEKTGDEALDEAGARLKDHFARVMWVHGAMIYTLAVRLSGNTVEGQQLAEETFVKAYSTHAQIRAENSVAAWLYGICIGLWKEKVRLVAWFQEPTAGESVEFVDVAAASPEGEMGIEGLEEIEAIQKALTFLAVLDRALIVMRDMDGKSYEEVCKLLEVPISAVKPRIARSREKLREILAPLLSKGL